MRKLYVVLAVAATLTAGRALAGEGISYQAAPVALSGSCGCASSQNADNSSSDMDSGPCRHCGGGDEDGDSDGDGRCHGGRHAQKKADQWFNCNCHGSYKFPVPPLYTYHWPGLYSMQRMTDYHSPWRFPPLKPYQDETPVRDLSQSSSVRQASEESSVESERLSTEEPLSAKISRYYSASE